ncbi:hypothetical protein L208DRAFT_1414530 [Tricholoma matsutake]|nr:hypothetical protein L208DRAFT_1414530 [Tricholoma matsutake 945]
MFTFSPRIYALRTSFAPSRALHSTPVSLKSMTEKVSEVADKVNKKVGEGLASAIDAGEKATKATKATKESLGSTAAETKEKAEHASDQKANQAATGAHEAKEHFKKEVRK